MIETLSIGVVLLFGAYLVILGVASFVKPQLVFRFFGKFAQSRRNHFVEMFARILAGAGLVSYSPFMFYSHAFEFFGWMLVVTSVGLLLTPWHLHQRFANKVVPGLFRYISFIGLVSLASGVFILICIAGGNGHWEFTLK